MKIVIKPLGAFLVLIAIVVLAVMAFRNQQKEDTAGAAVVSTTPTSPASISPTSPAATAAMMSVSPVEESKAGHAIFRDHAENGWQTQGWTWEKDVDFAAKKPTFAGSTAIRVRFTDFEGLKFHHAPLDARSFDRITFCLNGGPKGGQMLQVGGNYAEKNMSDHVVLSPLPANKWVSVTVPLDQINLRNRPDMTSFWIQGNKTGAQDSLYVDEVRLLKPGEPTPNATPLAITAVTQ